MAKKKAKAKVVTIKREQKEKFAEMLVNNLSIDEIVARLKADEKDKLLAAKEVLRKVCPELFLLGVAQVVAHYDGEGDSGDIQGIYANDINGVHMPWPKNSDKLRDAVLEAVWEFIPGGFEINDGSFGDITIKIETNEIVRQHNERTVEIDESERTFTF